MSPARLAALVLALLAFGCAATQEPSVLALDRMGRASATDPGIARLDARMREALRAATAEAETDGVDIVVNSGWRSRAHQAELFEAAVAEHGSEAAAAAWVARPGTSAHEAGLAVDVGPQRAADWLAEHGADHGLCRVYDNEPWHFELDPAAPDRGCPPTYDDPTDDPRLSPAGG